MVPPEAGREAGFLVLGWNRAGEGGFYEFLTKKPQNHGSGFNEVITTNKGLMSFILR